MNQKETFQEIFTNLVNDHKVKYGGELVDAAIHEVKEEVIINFEDEPMMYLISGNCAIKVYDDMEKKLAAAGWEITDTDGCIMHLTKTS